MKPGKTINLKYNFNYDKIRSDSLYKNFLNINKELETKKKLKDIFRKKKEKLINEIGKNNPIFLKQISELKFQENKELLKLEKFKNLTLSKKEQINLLESMLNLKQISTIKLTTLISVYKDPKLLKKTINITKNINKILENEIANSFYKEKTAYFIIERMYEEIIKKKYKKEIYNYIEKLETFYKNYKTNIEKN